MSDSLLVAIITSCVTLAGVYIQNSKTTAVIETKLQHLTEAVHKHNAIIDKVPVLEEQIKVANNRIKDLENK